MSTILQQKLAKEIATANGKKNKQEMLVTAGYSMITAEASASRTFEQKGVQKELKQLGFTEYNAKKVVGKILLNEKIKPDTRILAAREVFKVVGSYAPEKHQNLNLNIGTLLDELNKV